MIESAFYFILRDLFVLEIFKFLSWLFCHVENMALVTLESKINFEIHVVTYFQISHEVKSTRQWNVVN